MVALCAAAAGIALYRPAAGALAARLFAGKLAARSGLLVVVGGARAGQGGFTLHDLRVGAADQPLLGVRSLFIPWLAPWGRGTVRVDEPRLTVTGGLAQVRRLRDGARGENRSASSSRGPARRWPQVAIAGGSFSFQSAAGDGVPEGTLTGRLTQASFDANRAFEAVVEELAAVPRVAAGEAGAGFGARKLRGRISFADGRPVGLPVVEIEDGYAQALPHLGLSGISGRLAPAEPGAPAPAVGGKVALQFRGSYGGSKETLWQAVGTIVPAAHWRDSEGELHLNAERFSLDKIRDVLQGRVVDPARTSVDASLRLSLSGGALSVKGKLDVADLTFFHQGLSSVPVEHLFVSAALDASLDLRARVLHMKQVFARLGDGPRSLSGRLAGTVALAPAGAPERLARIELALDIPAIPCNQLLESFPRALIPHLQGFDLRGTFATHLETRIDFAQLDNLVLDGSVGIDGCRVLAVPVEVARLTEPGGVVTREIEIPPAFGAPPDQPEVLVFGVGPDNPDFVPYENISPHVVNAILTTEDSRFFRHKGFAVPEFKTALKRNLARGGFRLGASSISMQMVKNLLLSREKTLSRKLQELFLVWYLEQVLSKERILELYLNGIEYGPRLYGIGAAARHYFGKPAAELDALQAAFLATLLPSPVRRYVQYCNGTLSDTWKRFMLRVLTHMHERDRLTAEEFAAAQIGIESFAFDLTARTMSDRECRDWIKQIVDHMSEPVADPPVTLEGDGGNPVLQP